MRQVHGSHSSKSNLRRFKVPIVAPPFKEQDGFQWFSCSFQSYPSVNDMVDFKDCCETGLDTSLSFGTMRKLTMTLLEEIQKELDKLAATGEILSEFYKILCKMFHNLFFFYRTSAGVEVCRYAKL